MYTFDAALDKKTSTDSATQWRRSERKRDLYPPANRGFTPYCSPLIRIPQCKKPISGRCLLPLAPGAEQRPREHRTGRTQRLDLLLQRRFLLRKPPALLLLLVELGTHPSDLDAQRGHRRALASVHTGIVEQPRQPVPVRFELQRVLRCPAHPRKLLTRCMQLRTAVLEQPLVACAPQSPPGEALSQRACATAVLEGGASND